jgi:hypothetical protein
MRNEIIYLLKFDLKKVINKWKNTWYIYLKCSESLNITEHGLNRVWTLTEQSLNITEHSEHWLNRFWTFWTLLKILNRFWTFWTLLKILNSCSEYLAQKLVCSESLDFVVVLNNEYLSYPNISVKLLLLLVRSWAVLSISANKRYIWTSL